MTTLDIEALKRITPQDWASFAVDNIAFVRQVEADGQMAWGIFAADGTPLSVVTERVIAHAAIRQHGLEPADVH